MSDQPPPPASRRPHDNVTSAAAAATLGSMPSEILQQIFNLSTTPSFFQLLQVNRRFFSLASQSREIILHHLRHMPGIKLGLEHHSNTTDYLFLIFRQRAASHLYGVNFTADCRSWALSARSGGTLDPGASCLGVESEWGNNVCLVRKNSLRIRMNCHNDLPGDIIESPYGDGQAKIIQVVQKSHYITVLYAWTPPKDDPAHDTSHPEPTTVKLSVREVLEEHAARQHRSSRYRRPPSSTKQQNNQSKTSPSLARVRYHLLHYDMFRSEKPVFFPIPTHKSINDNILVPVHLAVHNRLECAILWDVPDTMTPSLDATVCLYTTDHLPRDEQGAYDVWVLYPFDRPSANYRSRSGDRLDSARENSDDDIDGSGITYTVTAVREKFHRSGYDVGQDLRLLYFPLRPRAIAFFKEGRRLSLYAPGSSVPFTTLLANEALRSRVLSRLASPVANYRAHSDSLSLLRRRVRRTNNTSIVGAHFTLGLPFFTTHQPGFSSGGADPDPMMPEVACVSHMLCLGAAKLPSFRRFTEQGVFVETGPQVLTIVQIRKHVLYDDCPHTKSKDDLPPLPRPPQDYRTRRDSTVLLYPTAGPLSDVVIAPEVGNDDDDAVGNNNFTDNDTEPDVDAVSDTDVDDADADSLRGTDMRVAARLWGWTPQRTTLTGLDTVCISPRGERIAVAQWDRVLVYALDPRELCDEIWDQDSDFEDFMSEGESSSESGSESEHDDADDADDNDASVVSVAPDGVPEDDHTTQDPAAASAAAPPPKVAAPVASSTSSLDSLANLLHFYPHTNDGWPLERIVELRPLVLKMDGGAVVRKMSWALGKLVRDDEECSIDAAEIRGKAEDAEGPADETAGGSKEKEKEDVESNKSNNTARLTPRRLDARTSADAGSFDPQDRQQLQNQPSPISDVQTATFSRDIYNKELGDDLNTVFHDIPPAPFSDTKLIGQIKHIARPPEYHNSSNKVVLDSPELRPHNPAVLDSGKGKETELVENSPGGRRDEFRDMTTDHERGMSPVPERCESGESEPVHKRKRNPRRRVAENELVVLTDRGLQVWDLSVWGRGRRIRRELPSDDILH
ncbi:hypothetical protein AYL99_05677 [Fonsecaea erecta]|uniref:F-box domain-containing protein n=1 Tax=Fonsecaea erecta TaxID=1367422 RepID=A0A178ZNT9_9EURO|nr:hypothetical protein AYL99_05677 [Fonsecaea erecta]OAP60675.1 hypothetical protein AYL99_05677 [Fonsecaea erecta]